MRITRCHLAISDTSSWAKPIEGSFFSKTVLRDQQTTLLLLHRVFQNTDAIVSTVIAEALSHSVQCTTIQMRCYQVMWASLPSIRFVGLWLLAYKHLPTLTRAHKRVWVSLGTCVHIKTSSNPTENHLLQSNFPPFQFGNHLDISDCWQARQTVWTNHQNPYRRMSLAYFEKSILLLWGYYNSCYYSGVGAVQNSGTCCSTTAEDSFEQQFGTTEAKQISRKLSA